MNLSPTDIKLFELFANKELTDSTLLDFWEATCNEWRIWIRKIWETWLDSNKRDYICRIESRWAVFYWDDWHEYYDVDDYESAGESEIIKPVRILWHEPQLHDILRVVGIREDFNSNIHVDLDWIRFYPYHSGGKVDIPYDPTKPLLSQEESTKSQLIDLFTSITKE